MKKIIALVLALMMLFAACTAFAEPLLGGWNVPEDYTMNEENAAIFEKVFAELTGADYEPIALIGTQVVAGMNYKFFAKQILVTGEPVITYGIVTIYVDVEGNASFTDYIALVTAPEEGMAGAFAPTEEYALTEEQTAMIEEALEGLAGAGYEPIAVVATQVVAGTNYKVFAKQTLVTAEPVVNFGFMTIYQDLEGNASFLDFAVLDAVEVAE